jgi:hypothetical protein
MGSDCIKPEDAQKRDALLFAARDYLATMGWTALVGSVDRIQEVPTDRPQYELVLRFTGAAPTTAKSRLCLTK